MNPHNAIVRILNIGGETEGTGFLAGPDHLIVTCAHVVEEGRGAGTVTSGDIVRLHFHAFERGARLGDTSQRVLRGCQEYAAHVEAISASDALDIAVLRLDVSPAELDELFSETESEIRLEAISIGSSYGAEGRDFSTFGFSFVKRLEGTPGECHVTGPTTEGSSPVLALNSKDVSRGFSGAPVWDRTRLTAIGIVVSIIGMAAAPDGGSPRPLDPFGKQIETGYLIPSEVLLGFYPALRTAGDCPFREFERFEEEHADDYFGRDKAIRTLVTHLRDHDFCIVSGVSGSGKSSLIRAGLARGLRVYSEPSLLERKRIVIIPGLNPIADLQKVLGSFVETGVESSSLSDFICRGDGMASGTERATDAACAFRDNLRANGVRLLLIVDQFERIYSEDHESNDVQAIVSILDSLAGAEVKVLIALRADYLGAASATSAFTRRMNDCLITLPPILSSDELTAAIVEPAQRRGCRVDDELLHQLIQDVAGRAGNLPLLQFGLTRLWEQDASRGSLTLASYKALGYYDPETDRLIAGVQGMVVRRAELIWDELNGDRKAAAERIFLALYNTDMQSSISSAGLMQEVALPFSSRRASMGELDPLAQEVAADLSNSFLLTLGHDDSTPGGVTIEVSHEALLWSWPRILNLSRKYADFIRWRNLEFAPFLRRWIALSEAEQQAPVEEYLLPLSIQSKAEDYLKRFPDKLSGPPENLIRSTSERIAQKADAERQLQESERTRALLEVRTRRRLRRSVFAGASVAFAVTLAATVGSYIMRIQSRRITSRDLLQQASAAIADKDFGQAETLAANSLSYEDRPETRSVLLEGRARAGRAVFRLNLRGRILAIGGRMDLAASVEKVEIKRTDERGKVQVASLSQIVHIADLKKGTEEVLPALTGDEQVSSAAFSRSGDRLWYGTTAGAVRVWDITGNKPADTHLPAILSSTKPAREPATISVIVCNPNPAIDEVAYGNEAGQTALWHPRTRRQEILPETSKAPIWALSYSSTGRLLASGDGSNLLRCWSMTDQTNPDSTNHWKREFTAAAHSDVVQSVDVARDGTKIASASADGTIRIWNAQTGAMQRTLAGHLGAVTCVAFTADGERLVSGGEDGTVRLWSVVTGQLLMRISVLNGDTAFRVGISGGSLLAGGLNGDVEKWVVQDREEGYALHNASGTMATVDFSPDGLLIAAAGDDYIGAKSRNHPSCIRLFRSDLGIQDGPELKGHENAINCVAFSPDGSYLVSGDKGGHLLVWRRVSALRTLPSVWVRVKGTVDHAGEVTTIGFLAPGVIASGSRAADGKAGSILVTNLATMQSAAFPHEGGSVFCLATIPGSGRLVSAGGDGSVRIWKYPSAAILSRSRGVNIQLVEETDRRQKIGDSDWAAAVSPGGTLFAIGSTNQTLRIADFTARWPARDVHARPSGIYSLSFSVGGKWLAAGYSDSNVVLWHAGPRSSGNSPDDYAVSATLRWHTQPVSWVSFSHDGRFLATAGLDGDLRVWNMDQVAHDLTEKPNTLISEANSHAGIGAQTVKLTHHDVE